MILVICPNPSVDTYIHFKNFLPGKSNRIIREQKYPGGKGVHVAFALKELNEDTVLLAFWGGDNGKWIKEQCIKTGIECIGPQTEEPNRICYTFKTEDNFNETEILGIGPDINSSAHDKFIYEFRKILPQTEIIVISGSLPPGCPADLYQNILDIATGEKIPLFIDCVGEPFRLATRYYCEGIHLNYKEFNELFSAGDQANAAKLLATKSRYAAITDGKKGLYLASNKTLIHAHLYLEKIYSAVGSGDCLLAGLVASRRREYSLSEMACLGVACAAAKCVHDELGLIHIKDVLDLLPKVNVEIIE